jgi:hypothetical protein
MNIIPIPIGYKIKFEMGYKTYIGFINKYMMPGYSCQFMPDSTDRLRYCVVDVNDLSHSFIIYEEMVKSVDHYKLYHDESYQTKLLAEFKQFKDSQSNPLTIPELSQKLKIITTTLGNLSSKVNCVLDFNDKTYYLTQGKSEFNKVTLFHSNIKKHKSLNVWTLYNLIKKDTKFIEINPGYLKIKSIDIDINNGFIRFKCGY